MSREQFLTSRLAERGEELERVKAENEHLRWTLTAIKEKVVGDKNPRWSDDWQITHMRGRIADLCDVGLNPSLKKENA